MEHDEDEFDETPARTPRPASLLITLLGLGFCLYLLAQERQAILYWFSSAEPVELGGPEQFQLDAAADNVLATITGSAGKTAVRYELFGSHYEIVAIPGTNILVRREQLHPLPVRPGESIPPPSQERFTAEGRLVVESSAPDYLQAFRTLVEAGDAAPRRGELYILFDGERPRTGWRTPLFAGGLTLVALLNLRALVRYLRARRRG